VAWSPDGTRVATAAGNPKPTGSPLSRENRVAVWKPLQLEPLILQAEIGTNWFWTEMRDITWNATDARLEGVMEVRLVGLIRYAWDIENGVLLEKVEQQITDYTKAYVEFFGVPSPDGRLIAHMDETNITIIDQADGTELISLVDHSEPVNAVAWSPDGERLVSVSGNHPNRNDPDGGAIAATDATVRIWDPRRGEQLAQWASQTVAYTAVDWFAGLIAVGDWAGDVQIRDANTGEIVALLQGHRGMINTVSWSPDGELLATAGQDQTVRVWSIPNENPLRIWEHPAEVTRLVWSPDSDRIATSANDDAIRIWLVRMDDVLSLATSLITRNPPTFTAEEIQRFDLPFGDRDE
jgi:WD40 repeat protein